MNTNHYTTTKKSKFTDIVHQYDAFFFDCDGVLWQDCDKLPYAFESLDQLKDLGKHTFFVTNSSATSRRNIQDKLKLFGFDQKIDKIFTSSYLAGLYLNTNHPNIKKAYVIGSTGIIEELNNFGISVLGSHDDKNKPMDTKLFKELQIDPEIGAVVAGFDSNINFYKFAYASLCIQNGAIYIATNEDANMMLEGRKMPGGGTMVRGLAKCSDKEPIVVGKPNPACIDLVCKMFSIEKTKCLMIGDRLDTDIKMGHMANIHSFLVLTGVTSEETINDMIKNNKEYMPTYYNDNLS